MEKDRGRVLGRHWGEKREGGSVAIIFNFSVLK